MSLRVISAFLPKSSCSVLDVGRGPGRYAIELARQGYSVTLLDISRENLRLARQKANEAQVSLAGIIHANAVDLGELDSDSYDIGEQVGADHGQPTQIVVLRQGLVPVDASFL